MSDDLIGRILGGRFRLEKQLGAGGMGAVYVALDGVTGAQVAVKVIRESLSENPEAISRFDREVQATAALQHPNIVRFLASGQDGGLRYLAMELLHGRSLKERISSRGAIPWRDTLPIMRAVASALGAAHRQGLIHRDLKPDNVFLVDDPSAACVEDTVKLLDFGVAKHTALPEGMTMTGTGMVVGTPGFVAPEVVLKGVADDPRSDFYGLGATWFEMLTGAKPFSAATPFALAMRHLNEQPPRPTALMPYAPVPQPLEELLLQLLAKTAEGRPKDADALLTALAALETASLTPMPSAMPTASPLDKTMTDMATPRVALVIPPPGAPATTPQTGFQRSLDDVEASALQRRKRRSSLRKLVLGVAVVAAAMAGRSLSSADKKRHRDRPRAIADAGEQHVLPLPLLDAGTPATALEPQPDAGVVQASVDAGAPAGVRPVDDVPRRREERRQRREQKHHPPQLDVTPTG